jgi:hypothetical protein
MTDRNSAIQTEYDQRADVLYLTIVAGIPASYEEDDDGLVWRLDSAGEPLGVTIMDYHAYWSRHIAHLTARLVSAWHLSQPTARKVLTLRR